MSLSLCILASGSSGNSTILRTAEGVILIDAGIGPRTTGKRMIGTGVGLADVRAICLTHLDRDHFTPTWFNAIGKYGIRLFCHEDRRHELAVRAREVGAEVEVETFDGRPFAPLPKVKFHPLRLAHDEMGSQGFVIEGFGSRIGYATDLGRVPKPLLEHFRDLDVLAIESNYDPQMQLDSPRPYFLKQRIMGGHGHLSNEQAFEAVCMILDRSETNSGRLPQHIVLLHRSRQCNCPKLLRKFFERDPRIAPRLTLAEQFERTEWISPRSRAPFSGEQLCLPM